MSCTRGISDFIVVYRLLLVRVCYVYVPVSVFPRCRHAKDASTVATSTPEDMCRRSRASMSSTSVCAAEVLRVYLPSSGMLADAARVVSSCEK